MKLGQFIIAVLLLVCGYSVQGQSQDSVRTSDFIEYIESKGELRIHWDSSWDLPVKIATPNSSLSTSELLSYLSRSIGFKVSRYDQVNYIVINETVEFTPEVEQISALQNSRVKTIGQTDSNPNRLASTLTGRILDGSTGEPIIGATIQISGSETGTSTNSFGKFTIEMPFGTSTLVIQSIGYKAENQPIRILSSGNIDIELYEESQELEEITILADAMDENVKGSLTGLTRLNMKGIKNMPSFMGETDIVKSIIMLPGVNTVGEGSSGFNVRGGETSQNLILLDEMIIFNPSHLFGFFTAFQGDLINQIDFYKGGMPANYGGRLASVLQVQTREGSMTDFKGKISAGVISSTASFEGPLVKDKGSFMVGGRGSYINWMLRKTKNLDLIKSKAGFGDYMGKASVFVGESDKLTVSGYLSWDNFKLVSDTTYQIQNQGVSLKWDHIFNPTALGSLSLVAGKNGTTQTDDIGFNAFVMNNEIDYKKLKYNFNLTRYSRHKIDIGIESILYTLNPGEFLPSEENRVSEQQILPLDRSLETALYFNDQFDISEKLSATLGLRVVGFAKLGSSKVYLYQDDENRKVNEIVDSLEFRDFQSEKFYNSIEPRFSLRYSLTPSTSVKVGYNRVFQYLHLITNSTTVVPTDFWMNSNYHIEPSIANQVSLGIFRNLRENMYETSFEMFYKTIENALDYREGGNIFLNRHLEADLLSGIGRAYGFEVFAKKTQGRLTGWVSYTYSRSLRKVASDNPETRINRGLFYASNFDKPHDVSFVGQYSLSKRIKFNWNFVYGSGRPVTAPDSRYSQVDVRNLYNYSERNQYRIPVYHRVDLGLTVEENLRNDKNVKTSWTLSVYNAYGRKNAYSVFFNNSAFAYKLSVLGSVFPSLTYKINFL